MKSTQEQLEQARMRQLAKKFKYSIPAQLAIHLPDEMIDKIPDEYAQYFLDYLRQIGLQQQPSGHWERSY